MSETTIPRKWEILPLDHPTVLRRLVKELNHRDAGFYGPNGARFNQARLHAGRLQVRFGSFDWTDCPADSLYDHASQPITASRTRCGH